MKTKELTDAVNEYLSDKDIELINISFGAGNIIEIEIDALSGVTIQECATMSKYIEERVDREEDDYELTVSSYSVSSPFKSILQYRKNIGRDVEINLLDGSVITAKLTAVKEDIFTLEYDEKITVEGKKRKEMKHFVVEVAFSDVSCAKLLF